MARVRFIDQDIQVEVPVGTSILEAARQGHAPLGEACGGECACSTCHVLVERGLELLNAAAEEEEDRLDYAFDVRHNSRLGCQARIRGEGEVAVRISDESLEAFHNEHPEVERPAG
jgi:2Fe-2S ferredoxin